jgi:hypothetical protein
MNRHQHRRSASQMRCEFDDGIDMLSKSGPMEMTTVNALIVLDPDFQDAMVRESILKWIADTLAQRITPLCMTCETQWTGDTRREPPPAMFAIMRTAPAFLHESTERTCLMVSGVCFDCVETKSREQLMKAMLDNYRKIWPDLTYCDLATVSDMPEMKQ